MIARICITHARTSPKTTADHLGRNVVIRTNDSVQVEMKRGRPMEQPPNS